MNDDTIRCEACGELVWDNDCEVTAIPSEDSEELLILCHDCWFHIAQ